MQRSARRPLRALCGPGRRSGVRAGTRLLRSPPPQPVSGGRGRDERPAHMSRSRAAARSPSLPRAGSRRALRRSETEARGPRARGGGQGRRRRRAGLSSRAGGRTKGGGIRGAGGGGGAAGATRPPRAGPARGKLRGRRRGLGKDTCCTVLWMVVSGDWDSFSSCRIC